MNEVFRRAAARLDAEPATGRQPAIEPEEVWRALASVIDPEIGLDIVSLGLVYEVSCEAAEARIRFTLTTPGCPLATVITRDVEHAVQAVSGVARVVPELVWEPRWHPGMMREGTT